MDPYILVLFALALPTSAWMLRHQERWFAPGRSLALRILAFALVMPVSALACLIAWGTILSAVGA